MAENSGKNKGIKNLKPFKKGISGNPNGRPLGQKNYSTLYKEALIKLAELNGKNPDELELEIISKGIMNARKVDYKFYKDVLDRLLGPAVIKADLTSNGKDIVFMPMELMKKYNLDATDTSTELDSLR